MSLISSPLPCSAPSLQTPVLVWPFRVHVLAYVCVPACLSVSVCVVSIVGECVRSYLELKAVLLFQPKNKSLHPPPYRVPTVHTHTHTHTRYTHSNTHAFTHTHTHFDSHFTHTHSHANTHTRECTHTHAHTQAHTTLNTSTHTRIDAKFCESVHVQICVLVTCFC